jgi:hypothetical protein
MCTYYTCVWKWSYLCSLGGKICDTNKIKMYERGIYSSLGKELIRLWMQHNATNMSLCELLKIVISRLINLQSLAQFSSLVMK